MLRTIIISIVIFLHSLAAQSMADLDRPEETFKKGTLLLNKNKYKEAIEQFTTLINQKQFAPELFLQMGNAHYRLQNIGLAALSYRRALLLKSNSAEARQNLELIKDKTGFVDTDPSDSNQILNLSNEALIGTTRHKPMANWNWNCADYFENSAQKISFRFTYRRLTKRNTLYFSVKGQRLFQTRP